MKNSVLDAIIKHAELQPHKVALSSLGISWTYSHLTEIAASASEVLAAATDKSSEACIAILVSHPNYAVAAMLTAIWCGRPWVILDSQLPDDRVREVVADCGPDMMLCDKTNTSRASCLGVEILILDDIRANALISEPRSSNSNLAYLLYTSGSTGAPKAVLQNHENLALHIDAYIRSVNASPEDRFSLVAPLSTDAALMDVFGALCSGASLHTFDVSRDGVERLWSWMTEEGITIFHSTPTVFRALSSVIRDKYKNQFVRYVVLGGEPAYKSDFDLYKANFGRACKLINGLGPSECTVALQAKYEFDDLVEEGPLPVGSQVAGIDAWLVDSNGRLSDSVGELVVAGTAVALGYWNDEAQTHAVFHQENGSSRRRVYFTGDICERTAAGVFVHQGRKDNQVKIYGHRIELGEIESAIKGACPARFVAVAKATPSAGIEVLVAVIVPEVDASVDIELLRTDLQRVLPSYKIPGEFCLWDEIPMTRSGKIDRRALVNMLNAQSLMLQPRSDFDDIESWLANEWNELLKCSVLDRNSSFFGFGGNSLHSFRLMARIFDHFAVSLPPAALLENPRLFQVANLIRKASTSRAVKEVKTPRSSNGTMRLDLSPQQGEILAYMQLTENYSSHHITHCFETRGPIDRTALRSAIELVVGRHEALRLRIVQEEGVPRQEIATVRVDIRHRTIMSSEEWEIDQLIATIKGEQFELENGPLFRFETMECQSGRHFIVFVCHHLILDGISIRQFLREIEVVYSARIAGTDPKLPEIARTFSDWINWQTDWFASQEYAQQRAWWMERVSRIERGAPPMWQSRGERPRMICAYRSQLPEFATEEARRSIESLGATPYSLYLAAFSLVLKRHGGQSAICIATPVSNRYPHEFSETLGMFVNTLYLCVDVDEALTVREYVERVHKEVIGALNCSGVPASHIGSVGAFLAAEEVIRPFASVMLAVQDLPKIGGVGSPLFTRAHDRLADDAVFDLCVTVNHEVNPPEIEVSYCDSLYSGTFVAELVKHFRRISRGLIGNHDIKLNSLSVHSQDEIRELIGATNNESAGQGSGLSVPAQIRQMAELAPWRIALACDDDEWTYCRLVSTASAIARAISAFDLPSGAIVPVLCERGPSIVAGWLGVLFAGAAFVPIDSQWPRDRIARSLESCGCEVVLCQADHRGWLREKGFECVDLDASYGVDQAHVPSEELKDCVPDDPVYGIFTSGTTGVPKLALVAHRGLNNRFDWMNAVFVGDAPPTTLQTTPHVFDSAVWQLLWPLTQGGRVVIPAADLLVDAGQLLRLTSKHRISIIDFVPSVFDSVVEYLESTSVDKRSWFESVEHLILGGEQVLPGAIGRFTTIFPQVQVHNLYGPTEATIGCVHCTLNGVSAPFPIGKPISNVSILLLDEYLRIVPKGAVGEIYIGGQCVGLGYRNDPERTAKAFLTNPYEHFGAGRVLYRTGDLGRMRPDGLFECLGRIDSEVKIRGVRINLSEIEAILCQHPEIRSAAVDVRTPHLGAAPRLCAWVATAVPDDIREYCTEKLPTYLVPEVFFECDSLPIAASGKLDRKALAYATDVLGGTDVNGKEEQGRDSIPAQVVQVLAHLMSSVLKVPRIGRDDNFFNRGGNSLYAMILVSRINDAFNASLQITDIYRAPTPRKVARLIYGGSGGVDRVVSSQEAAFEYRRLCGPTIEFSAGVGGSILITGATGFVGRFLLRELLDQGPENRIICLVRGATDEDAWKRLTGVMQGQGLLKSGDLERISIVRGDLSKEGLGLTEASRRIIRDEVSNIIHCGAQVNHLETYSMSKVANVDGVRQLLELASCGVRKTFNYVSTLSVFRDVEACARRTVDESTPIDSEIHYWSNGYCSSKWVAETLIAAASARGVPCNIFRLGLVTSDAKEGRFDKANVLFRLFASALMVGAGIDDELRFVTFTPVDFVARAMAHLSRKYQDGGGVFHLQAEERISVSDVFALYNELSGSKIVLEASTTWLSNVANLCNSGEQLPVGPFIDGYSEGSGSSPLDSMGATNSTLRYSCERTIQELSSDGIEIPRLTGRQLMIYFRDIEKAVARDRAVDLHKILGGAEIQCP